MLKTQEMSVVLSLRRGLTALFKIMWPMLRLLKVKKFLLLTMSMMKTVAHTSKISLVLLVTARPKMVLVKILRVRISSNIWLRKKLTSVLKVTTSQLIHLLASLTRWIRLTMFLVKLILPIFKTISQNTSRLTRILRNSSHSITRIILSIKQINWPKATTWILKMCSQWHQWKTVTLSQT